MMTRLRNKTWMVALVALLPAASSGLMYVSPIDANDEQDYSHGDENEDWFLADWTMDTIGNDWTPGTTEEPMSETVEDLRDAALQDLDTDALLPALQEKQRGIVSGTLTMEATLGSNNAAFMVEPGNGWFPSLTRDAGEALKTVYDKWEKRTVDGVQEKVDLSWSSTDPDCPSGSHDMLSGEDYAGTGNGDVEWIMTGGSADRSVAVPPDEFRNDRVVFEFVYTGTTACDFTVSLDFYLQFVHEADGQDVDSQSDVGYYRTTAYVDACRKVIGHDTNDDSPVCASAEDEDGDTATVDVLYAPIFPVEHAFFLVEDVCATGGMPQCLSSAASQRSASSYANMDIIHDGTEFHLFAFDKSATGYVTGQVFYLAEYAHDYAQGMGSQIVLI